MTSLSYSSYLSIDNLLDLQKPLSEGPEHDETLFIIIHQVYELWFKQILHELDFAHTHLQEGNMHVSMSTLKRILTILKTLVSQVDILETMTPLSFASFRGRLQNSSGFQSAQFREVECILGYKRAHMLSQFESEPRVHAKLLKRIHQKDLFHVFLEALAHEQVEIPASAFARPLDAPREACEDVQNVLLHVYRTRPDLVPLCERIVDLDEGFQEWRYRHVKMVERTLGAKIGTGGSAGVEYLKNTLFKPFFPDLWAIRSAF